MVLPVIDPQQAFQPEYQAAIDDLLKCLQSGLGSNLHSVYLYGSVAHKTAQPYRSNLDVIVVSYSSFQEQRSTLFNTIRWRFQQEFPFVTQVDFKVGLVEEIASIDGVLSWGFLLRHLSVCIYGDDLAECFGDYEPSWEIAKQWNMDVEDWLAVYRHRVVKAASPELQIKAQTIISKKLLRASYSLVMHRDKQWFDDPLECGRQFLRYYPERKIEIDRLGILYSRHLIEKRSVLGLLDGFGEWLVKQYKKTEFKIG